MSVKIRLQRVLQILEEAERVGALSALERDIVLAELRESYSEVKFGETDNEKRGTDNEVAAAEKSAAVAEPEAETDEPEMEIEIIFNEENERAENGEVVAEKPAAVVESAVAERFVAKKTAAVEVAVNDNHAETTTTNVEEYVIAEKSVPVEREKPFALNSPLPTPKRSALLSLYEESGATPVVGEQFREQPSVADRIVCPKGVAESTPVTSLREAIGVADKFMLVSELFGGDIAAYERTVAVLDTLPSFDDCVIYITENFSWRAQSEATKSIMSLLQRKFNE